MNGWASERKKSLTPQEVLMVAHAHLVGGIDQHALASMYSVNPGRIAEACVVMREAAESHQRRYRERRQTA